jgi:putative ATPase
MARKVSGDARSALNMLELLLEQYDPAKSLEDNLKELFVHESVRHYDKSSDRHYDVISAFIKSMRGSDPDAAILWLAVMIDGGEDPLFIARRLIIFASEDIGNADPSALSVAVNAFTAISHIGMPEGRITLGHAVTYLACAPKSNAAYLAINEALAYVKNQETIEVPGHLTHFSQTEVKYRYPHNYPRHFVPQQYMPEGTPQFYRPTEQAREKLIKNTQENLWQR